MEFEESFFKEETRCDFVVVEKMKRAWAAQMEVLSEIIRLCQKHGITYYANWGTLLGAVRHQGYVPWDDDVDIALKRKDYERLIAVLLQELPEGWKLSSIHAPGEHNQPHSCVMNSEKIITDPEKLEQFHGCPFIVGVDIFALDYVPRDEGLAESQKMLYNVAYDAARRCTKLEQSGEMEQYLPQIEELCRVKFDRSQPLRRQLWQLSERISGMFTEEESDKLTWMPRMMYRPVPYYLNKEWYADTVDLPFEIMQISAPTGYDGALTEMYGDYMTPRNVRGGHGYPFYKEQEEYLQRLKR